MNDLENLDAPCSEEDKDEISEALCSEDDKDEISDTDESVLTLPDEGYMDFNDFGFRPSFMFDYLMVSRNYRIYSRSTGIESVDSVERERFFESIQAIYEEGVAGREGVCPHFAHDNIPCTILSATSPELNKVQFILPDGCTIFGNFVDRAGVLRRGMYPTMLVFERSPARIFLGVKEKEYYSWVNTAPNGDENQNEPMQVAVWIESGRTVQQTLARVGVAREAGATVILLPASTDIATLAEFQNGTKSPIIVLIQNETKFMEYFKEEPQECFLCIDKECITCVICSEVMESGDYILTLPTCKHQFHLRCLSTWLHDKRTCPLCRAEFPMKKETDWWYC